MGDRLTPYESMLAHLIRMAKNPGFKAHAWHRAKELTEIDIYAGIDAALVKAMTDEKNGTSSRNPAHQTAAD